MAKRPGIKTTIGQAAKYWSGIVSECELSVDWSEAETHCWRCGCEKNLQRCHIVPHSLDGADEPSNIVLLCARCHGEAPNVADADIMWDWIKAYSVPLYETFWTSLAMREYKFIYRRTFVQDIKDVFTAAGLPCDGEAAAERIKKVWGGIRDRASVHFGQPYLNTATLAGMMRMALREMASELGVGIPEGKAPGRPWWMPAGDE